MTQRRLWAACALFLSIAPAARCCTVPVFRYALERWPPDPHVMLVRQGVDYSAPAKALNASHANLRIERATASQTNEVRVLLPDSDIVWYDGPWRPSLPLELADSPLRRQVARELVTGATAAWIILDGDTPATNEAVYAATRDQLKELESLMRLPEDPLYDPAAPQDPSSMLRYKVPIQVSFTLHRLDRNSDAERTLVRQILSMYPKADNLTRPVAVAVFGRGRAIPLSSEQVEAKVIAEVCAFLCEACSCQVKAMNPGVDLLMCANWDAALTSYPDGAETVLPDGKAFRLGGAEAAPADQGSPASEQPAAPATMKSHAPPVDAPVDTAQGTTAIPPAADRSRTILVVVILSGVMVVMLAAVFLLGRRR